MPQTASPTAAASNRGEVADFVDSAFSVRRNVVKVWRALPAGLWTSLDRPENQRRSVRAERRSLAGVAIMVLVLAGLPANIGYRGGGGANGGTSFPIIGRPMPVSGGGATGQHWFVRPGLSLRLVSWTVVPPLVGWFAVRGLWIPLVTRRRPHHAAAVAFARHLGSVYLFVYMMIVVGAALMPLLIILGPTATRTLRWWLWCFLFGESFFVPAVMWIRLVVHDRHGDVFGRMRYAGLALYLAVFVVLPLMGMVGELGRLP